MKRSIIPPTTLDRISAVLSLMGMSSSILAWFATDNWYSLIPGVIMALGGILSAYVYQDQPKPKSEEPNDYLEIISRLKDMGKQIESMSAFMEKEKKRIIEAKETLNQLLAEKKELQPIVKRIGILLMRYLKLTQKAPKSANGKSDC